jgi:hypothetical protein
LRGPLDKLLDWVQGVKKAALNLHELLALFSGNPQVQSKGRLLRPLGVSGKGHGVSDSNKHTDGPWDVVVAGRNRYVESVRARRLIAALLWSPDSEANARLIAAAPDLLTQCVYVLSLLERNDLKGLKEEAVHLRLLVDRVRKGDGEVHVDRPDSEG